jgi:hypothetical protein
VSRLQILIAVLVLVPGECLPSGSRAQNPSGAHIDSSLSTIVARISADSARLVRLSSRETGRIEGDRFTLLADSVSLKTASGIRAIAIANVDSLWVRGTATRLFGIIAAVPCALFGAMVGGFIGGDPDGQPSPGRELLFPIVGLLGGGAICGTVGAGVGSLIGRWRLEYPQPSEDST